MADTTVYTSGMIALIPSDEFAALLAVPGGLPSTDLHVTLAFLGEIEYLDQEDTDWCMEICRELASTSDAQELEHWGIASFNPTTEQASVYLIGSDCIWLDELAEICRELCVETLPLFPEQHIPFVPHMTIGYDLKLSMLDKAGTIVTYDKIRLALGDQIYDFPLVAMADELLPDSSYIEIENMLSSIESLAASYNRKHKYSRDSSGEFDTPPSGHYTEGSTKADEKQVKKKDKIKLYIETKSAKANRLRKSKEKHQGRSINHTGRI